MTPEPLLTADQVAERLQFRRERIWAMTRRGELPVVRIGPRDLRYDPTDIEAWIARRRSSRPKGTR